MAPVCKVTRKIVKYKKFCNPKKQINASYRARHSFISVHLLMEDQITILNNIYFSKSFDQLSRHHLVGYLGMSVILSNRD